jgi:hypothetical protein
VEEFLTAEELPRFNLASVHSRNISICSAGAEMTAQGISGLSTDFHISPRDAKAAEPERKYGS